MKSKFYNTIRGKLSIVLFAFATFIFIAVAFTLVSLNAQKGDARLINIAGRQRMLSQKITKEVLIFTLSSDAVKSTFYKKTQDSEALFKKSLNGMIFGDTSLGLSAPKNAMLIEELGNATSLWNEFYSKVEYLLNEKAVETKQYTEAKAIVIEKNDEILKKMVQIVDIIEADANGKISSLTISLIVVLFLSLILLYFGVAMINKFIVKPLVESVDIISKIAKGDLTYSLVANTEDEVGMLSRSMNFFIENLRNVMGDLIMHGNSLASSSNELSTTSETVAEDLKKASVQINALASTSEELSQSINNMAATSEQMSHNSLNVSQNAGIIAENIGIVVGSVEKINQSIKSIATNSELAHKVANKASVLATDAVSMMNELGKSADEIGDVTGLIKKIAEQTNLLALNARIEAASAGEAGKGFAVVANEIKELANQSAIAAEDISTKIEHSQANTAKAVQKIREISEVTLQIDSSINEIHISVKQQSIEAGAASLSVNSIENSIHKISSNISEIAQGTGELARSNSEAAVAINDVAGNISEINNSTRNNSIAGEQFRETAHQLASIAEELNRIVSDFKV